MDGGISEREKEGWDGRTDRRTDASRHPHLNVPRSGAVGEGCPPVALHGGRCCGGPGTPKCSGAKRGPGAAAPLCCGERIQLKSPAPPAPLSSGPICVPPPPFLPPPTSPISLTSPSPPPLQLSQAPAALLLCSPPLCQSVFPSPGARILFPAPPSTCLPTQVLSKGALRPLTPTSHVPKSEGSRRTEASHPFLHHGSQWSQQRFGGSTVPASPSGRLSPSTLVSFGIRRALGNPKQHIWKTGPLSHLFLAGFFSTHPSWC